MEELYKQNGYPGITKMWHLVKLNNLNYTYKEVKDFISKQTPYQLHKVPTKNIMHPITTAASQVNYQVDTLHMQKFYKENKGMKYILLVIDIFNRVGRAIPMLNNTSVDAVDAFKIATKSMGMPKIVTSDDGSEFKGEFKNFLKSNNILHSVTSKGDHNKLGMVDRFSKTIKHMLYKHFTNTEYTNWIDVIDGFVDSYNNSPNSNMCDLTPNEANKYEFDTFNCNMKRVNNVNKEEKLKVGDSVRIILESDKLAKGYYQKWSTKVYTIKEKKGLYYILDDGRKYRSHDLQLVNVSDSTKEVKNVAHEAKQAKRIEDKEKREDIKKENIITEKRVRTKINYKDFHTKGTRK